MENKKELLSVSELNKKMMGVSQNYYLIDVYNDRESYYAIPHKELQKIENHLCLAGYLLNLIMDGRLEESWKIIENIPETPEFSLFKMGLKLIHPQINWHDFLHLLNYLSEKNISLSCFMLTAGKPSVMNGLNDFSRIAPMLPKYKELFLKNLKCIYEEKSVPFIYNLFMAEYQYQQNKLMEAEMLVSSVIKAFDKHDERRLLFVALYLQSKILIAQGKAVSADSYIEEINRFSKEKGKAEFSYNIDAVHILFSLYEGNVKKITDWLKNSAPDEYASFNMLDSYRYVIKMRCYMVTKNYAAAIALAEKLRSPLVDGKHHMDLCEIDLLLAMNFFEAGKKDFAFEALERALKIARRRKYYRMVADEGEVMLQVLLAYAEEKGTNDFLMNIIALTREMAITHPHYLKVYFPNDQKFSQMEIDILKLLEMGKSKEEIGRYFFISLNTVKYHLKKIYAKLEASSSTQAVWNAKWLGVI